MITLHITSCSLLPSSVVTYLQDYLPPALWNRQAVFL